MKKQNPYNYLLRSSFEVFLWLVLYFCFKHDYKREDFVFVPIQATWVMAIIFALNLVRIITQFNIKLQNYKKQ